MNHSLQPSIKAIGLEGKGKAEQQELGAGSNLKRRKGKGGKEEEGGG